MAGGAARPVDNAHTRLEVIDGAEVSVKRWRLRRDGDARTSVVELVRVMRNNGLITDRPHVTAGLPAGASENSARPTAGRL